VKFLYLLRHAKSSWSDLTLADPDRPLAPRGRKAAAHLAEHVRGHGVRPDVVLCSPARRARETLQLVFPDDAAKGATRIEPAIYGGGAEELLAPLRALGEDTRTAMIVGHNPGVQDLALRLAGPGPDPARARLEAKFPTAALATFSVPGPWSGLGLGDSELVGFVTPNELAGR
jgi:phosphohistidine phosphatase